MKSIIPRLILLLIIGISSCNIINPKEDVPTYIKFDSVKVESVVPAIHGSVSHKITDVWVYYNRQLLGAYELPASVPILASGHGQVQLVAGIWQDGLSGIRTRYPFYTVDTVDLDASPGNTFHYSPTFRYRTTDTPAVSYFIEDFEQGNSLIPRYGDTSFVKTSNPADVFEGSWSSKLTLSDTDRYGESSTLQSFAFPPTRPCFLEFNYKSDVPFQLDVYVTTLSGNTSTISLTGINPSNKWNKLYFNFGGFVATYQNASFRFIFHANLPANKTEGSVWLDNFKIIHFN